MQGRRPSADCMGQVWALGRLLPFEFSQPLPDRNPNCRGTIQTCVAFELAKNFKIIFRESNRGWLCLLSFTGTILSRGAFKSHLLSIPHEHYYRVKTGAFVVPNAIQSQLVTNRALKYRLRTFTELATVGSCDGRLTDAVGGVAR